MKGIDAVNVSGIESDEQLDAIKSVAEDYYDYGPKAEAQFIEWKHNAKKTAAFWICEEEVNKKQNHVFQMILVVFNGENLQRKLDALRQLGYTAKLVKCL